MATLGTNNLTLTDWAKIRDPNGKFARIAELLSQSNGILEDMTFREGNLPTGMRVSIRTGLPAVYWRLMNQGTPSSKSSSAQVDEACGMLNAWSTCDYELAQLGGDPSGFRFQESKAFLESMSQEFASTVIYGNSGLAPEEFNGLAVRYSSLTGAGNSQNVLSAGGTSGSDQTSIYLVGWGDDQVFGVFPQGSQAGLQHRDMGAQVIENQGGVAGASMYGYRDQYVWNGGLVVKDWRYAVRICNIDTGNLVANTSPAALTTVMIKALHRIPNLLNCRPVFYMNRTVFEYLDLQRRADVISGGQLKYEVVDGKAIYNFRGIPVKIVDAITNSEAVVS